MLEEDDQVQELKHTNSPRLLAGIILIILGGLFLLQTLFHISFIRYFWPVILIVVGLAVIFWRRR